MYRYLIKGLHEKINSISTLFSLQRYVPSQSSAIMLDVTGTVVNADPTVLIA